MAGQIAIDKVDLVSIFVECILYGMFSLYRVLMGENLNPHYSRTGLFTFLFAVSAYVLLVRRANRKERINRPMLTVSIVMFILATVVSILHAPSIAVTRLRRTLYLISMSRLTLDVYWTGSCIR